MRRSLQLWCLVLGGFVALGAGPDPAPNAPAAPTAPEPAAPMTQERVLERLQRVPGLSARFREEKRMTLLVAPLVSEGTLHFAPPGRFARHTVRPARQSIVVEGQRLHFGDARGRQDIDLAANPAVRMFVDGFVSILAGDARALRKTYDLRFRAGDGLTWTMVLSPKLAPVDKFIARITIHGDDVVLREIETVEVGGDVTTMTFTEVDTSRRYTNAEARRIFRLPTR